MKNIEQTSVDTLKCDKEDCDYEVIVQYSEYTDWINKPCPKCGSNLLTFDDYERAKAVRDTMEFVNTLSAEELEELAAEVMKSGVLQTTEEGKVMQKIAAEDPNALVSMSVSTHKKIKIEEVKKLE